MGMGLSSSIGTVAMQPVLQLPRTCRHKARRGLLQISSCRCRSPTGLHLWSLNLTKSQLMLLLRLEEIKKSLEPLGTIIGTTGLPSPEHP